MLTLNNQTHTCAWGSLSLLQDRNILQGMVDILQPHSLHQLCYQICLMDKALLSGRQGSNSLGGITQMVALMMCPSPYKHIQDYMECRQLLICCCRYQQGREVEQSFSC